MAWSKDTCVKNRVRSKVTERKVRSGIEVERGGWAGDYLDGDQPKKRPHIWLDREENTSVQTSALVQSDILVWPPQQQGPRRNRWPGCQRKESR